MNEHKNIITIEDEIKEFSDKPVKSSALYKKVKELESNAVPDASEASVGDVLTKGEGGIGWSAPSGGGGETWESKFTLTIQGQKFKESLAEINAYDPQLGDKVTMVANGERHMVVLGLSFSGANLTSITLIDDILYPGLVRQTIEQPTGDIYVGLIDPSNNSELSPMRLLYNGSTVTPTFYTPVKLYVISTGDNN